MNPRQRRAVLLLALSVAGLFGVFALVANYVSEVEKEVGDKMLVLELTRPVNANERVPESSVRLRPIPRKWAPEAALTDYSQMTGLVAAADLAPNAILQEGMLDTPPSLDPGQREVAILVDASTGVAGRIQSGDRVDVIADYPEVEVPEGDRPRPNRSVVVVPAVEVIAIGQPRPNGASGGQEQQQPAEPDEVVPVTFALNPRQSLKVSHAQSYASAVRLALLPDGDPGARTLGESIYRGEDPRKAKDGTIR
jgi:pilus assembly protein CpaB